MTKSKKFLIGIFAAFVLYATYQIGGLLGFKDGLDANNARLSDSIVLVLKQRNILRSQQELIDILVKEREACEKKKGMSI